MNELVLLAALLKGPAYGYALKKTAGLIFGSKALHSNLVYPSLKKFVKNGWVEQTNKTQGERGQERKQYRITAAGTQHLLERLEGLERVVLAAVARLIAPIGLHHAQRGGVELVGVLQALAGGRLLARGVENHAGVQFLEDAVPIRSGELVDGIDRGLAVGGGILGPGRQQHGGEIEVSSEPGAGTRVLVRLPLPRSQEIAA